MQFTSARKSKTISVTDFLHPLEREDSIGLRSRRDGISDDVNIQAAVDEVDGRRDDADVGLDPAQDDRVDLGGQRLLNDNNIIILA